MKSGLFVLPLTLASCSGAPPRFDSMPSVICEDFLGRGWATLQAPPAYADDLMRLLDRPGLAENKSSMWFHRENQIVAVCFYGTSVCDSEAHVFRRSGTEWKVDNSDVADWICVA